MNIKVTLFALAAFCVVAGSVGAQSHRQRQRAKPAMWTALQLTDTQKSQVKTIHKKYAPAKKAAQSHLEAPTADSSARVFQREMTEVRDILTFSQQQTFDSYMNESKATRRGAGAKVLPVKIAVPR